jgi:hypothetical protein
VLPIFVPRKGWVEEKTIEAETPSNGIMTIETRYTKLHRALDNAKYITLMPDLTNAGSMTWKIIGILRHRV